MLFGVHAFWIHPIVVACAWKRLYGVWPSGLAEWAAIALHDVGYFGLPNLDGAQGRQHPEISARIAAYLLRKQPKVAKKAVDLILGHSKYYCRKHGRKVSKLYAPDKASILFEPKWFYFLRALLSGELAEFTQHAPKRFRAGPRRYIRWTIWYYSRIEKKFCG